MEINKIKCVLCDIDGVYVDASKWYDYYPEHGTREEWLEFQSHCEDCCTPNSPLINQLVELSEDIYIVFFTAREDTEYLQEATIRQIETFSDSKFKVGTNCGLVMRPYGVFDDDTEVKEMLLKETILKKYNPILVLDDNIKNIKMFEKYGLLAINYVIKDN